MAVLESRLDTRGEAFESNARHHRALAGELRDLAARIASGGDERSRERHVRRAMRCYIPGRPNGYGRRSTGLRSDRSTAPDWLNRILQ